MVEGPGVFRNRAKASAHTAKRVAGLSGARAAVVAEAARGRVLAAVLALGKELFLVFASPPSPGGGAGGAGETAIRVHFGMSGSCFVDAARPAGKNKALTLQVHFAGAGASSLRFFDATCSVVDAAAARAKVTAFARRDVCSPAFDRAAALAALDAAARAAPARLLADALLDQALLPGVGNIIKTEACARARVDPRRALASLAPSERAAVVAHAREYSLKWAKGTKPPPLWYDQTLCGACDARLRFQKLGNDAARPTFWCPACCEAAATAVATTAAAAAAARDGDDGAPPAGDDGAPPAGDAGSLAARFFAPRRAMPPRAAAEPAATAAEPPRKRARAACDERFACRAHGGGGRAASLRRARKKGPNAGRLFFGCRVPACDHFAWADAGFPKCRCKSAAVARLRVSKKAESGGRWFFGCGGVAPNRCDFFAWASEAHLEPLGGLLTPLT